MLIAKTGGGALITKKKKKAFTLIELLAIIVILAIIAVITVPIILNIIENSRKGAATDSAYGYKDAVNKAYIQELAKPNNENLKLNGIYTVQNDGTLVPATGYTFGVTGYNSLPVSLSGDKPSSGSLTYSNNVLTSGCLVIGDYAITFDGNETSTVKGDCSSNSGSSSSEQGNGGNTQIIETWDTYYYYNLVSIDNNEYSSFDEHNSFDKSKLYDLDSYFNFFARVNSQKKEMCFLYNISNSDDMFCVEANRWDYKTVNGYIRNKIQECENISVCSVSEYKDNVTNEVTSITFDFNNAYDSENQLSLYDDDSIMAKQPENTQFIVIDAGEDGEIYTN